MSPAEAAWIMAGSVLELLEVGGPDAVREQLGELPRSQREDVVRAVCDSGYPAGETIEDFRTLVAEPILSAPSRPRTVRRFAAASPARVNAAVVDNMHVGRGLSGGAPSG